MATTTVDPLTAGSGGSWPTDGSTATTGTTGLAVLTATTKWTHVAATVKTLHPGMSSLAVIRKDVGDLLGTFQVETTPVSGSESLLTFFACCTRESGALEAQGTAFTFHSADDPSGQAKVLWYLQNDTDDGNGDEIIGFTVDMTEGLTGTPIEVAVDGVGGASTARIVIPFDEWFKVGLRMKMHATLGEYQFYINDQPCYIMKGTAGDTWDTSTGRDIGKMLKLLVQFNTAASSTAMTWEIGGPLVWSDTAVSVTNDYSSRKARMLVRESRPTCFTQGEDAGHWTTSGTATITEASLATSGVNPRRRQITAAGASTTTVQMTTGTALGTLPFNEEGWATVHFRGCYFPGSTSQAVGQFRLMNAANDTALVDLDVETGNLSQSAVDKGTWNEGERYALSIHLSGGGQVKGTLWNLSKSYSTDSVPTIESFDLGTWAPQALGNAIVDGTIGTGAGDTSIELQGLLICRWLPVWMPDSYVHAPANGVTPAQGVPNNANVTQHWGWEDDPGSLNIHNDGILKKTSDATGITVAEVAGRSGSSIDDFITQNSGRLTHMRGTWWVYMGSQMNDLTLSPVTQANADARVVRITDDMHTLVDEVVANPNRFTYGTGVRPIDSTSLPGPPYTSLWDPIEADMVLSVNQSMRSTLRRHQRSRRVYFAETAIGVTTATNDSYFTATDDATATHMNELGDATYSDDFAAAAKVIEYPAAGVRGTTGARLTGRFSGRLAR